MSKIYFPTELWFHVALYLSPKEYTNLILSNSSISLFDQRVTLFTKARSHSPALITPDSFTIEAFEFIYRHFAYEIPHYRDLLYRIPNDLLEAAFEYLAKIKDVLVLRCLFESGISRSFGDQLPLRVFIELNQVDLVREILEHPLTDVPSCHGLVHASKRGYFELTRLLISRDQDPNALLFACQFGYVEICKFLMKRVDYRYDNGRAFILACLFNQPKVVHVLLQYEFFLQETLLRDGLGYAAFYGYSQVLSILLEKYKPPFAFVEQLLKNCCKSKSCEILRNLLF